MKFNDFLEEVYIALLANKTRSALTVLGIVIGIASVISMIAIGEGAKKQISDNIQSIGSNLLTVRPGAPRGAGVAVAGARGDAQTLTLKDTEFLATSLNGQGLVSPEVTSRSQVVSKSKNSNVQIVGTTPESINVKNMNVEYGSFILDSNVKVGAKVAVIGANVATDLFGEASESVIGQSIKIKNANYKVIGILELKGGSGFGTVDDQIILPISTVQNLFTGNQYVSNIYIKGNDDADLTTLKEQVTDLLIKAHKLKDEASADFQVINQADIAATASGIATTFTYLLGAVAGISLLVGGIGIMNMMLTNVTERTREIGLRKAIGAKEKDIQRQFLFEAIVLTVVGGIIGIILGYLISYGFTALNIITTSVNINSILLAFTVSAVIGIIFGYYPAKQASKLNPIEALRYE